jgi:uncharacterized protein (TIGR02300 family)
MKEIKMPKEEWGVKRVCPTTGKRFYDLNRNPIVSPYTGEVVELDTSKTRMIAADSEDVSSKGDTPAELDAEDVVLDEEEVDVDLGDDLLEEDDEDDNVPLEEITDMPSEDDS